MRNENIRSLTDASVSDQRELEYQTKERKREREREEEKNQLVRMHRNKFPNARDQKPKIGLNLNVENTHQRDTAKLPRAGLCVVEL